MAPDQGFMGPQEPMELLETMGPLELDRASGQEPIGALELTGALDQEPIGASLEAMGLFKTR